MGKKGLWITSKNLQDGNKYRQFKLFVEFEQAAEADDLTKMKIVEFSFDPPFDNPGYKPKQIETVWIPTSEVKWFKESEVDIDQIRDEAYEMGLADGKAEAEANMVPKERVPRKKANQAHAAICRCDECGYPGT